MFSWPNLSWYVCWKIYEWKVSRRIWGTMWIGTDGKGWCRDLICGAMLIGTDDKGWCRDLIWGAMLIGTDDKGCSHDLIWSAAFTQNDVTERFDDHLEWICDWNSSDTMLSWPNLWCYVDWKGCEIMFLRYQFNVRCGLEQMWKDAVMTKFEFLCGMEQMIRDVVMTQFEVLCELEMVWKEAFTTNLR
jgi:hypothetical protein